MNNKKQTPDITSSANHTFRRWKALLGSKGIRSYGEALVSGQKIIQDLCEKLPRFILQWIVSPRTMAPYQMSPFCSIYPHTVIEDRLFHELDIFGTHYPLLHVKIPEIVSEIPSTDNNKLLLYLPFQDPMNIGAVARTAVAFGVSAMVLLEESAHPFHPKSIRASAGAVFAATFSMGPSLSELTADKYPMVGLSSDGKPLSSFTFPSPCGLVPGMEGQGLKTAPEFDHTIAIPMSGEVESLNAVVATSITLYEWFKQQHEIVSSSKE